MARKLTRKQIASIHANKGLPVRDIARRAGVSTGAVSNTLNASAPKKRAKSGRLAPSAKPNPPTAATLRKGDAEGSQLERLDRVVRSLEHSAQIAAADGDQARVVAALRAVSDVTKTIATLTPAPPVDHNEHPDMVQAAKECRDAECGLLERIIAEAEASK